MKCYHCEKQDACITLVIKQPKTSKFLSYNFHICKSCAIKYGAIKDMEHAGKSALKQAGKG
jgi:protein-arginine kinase activator protein McsA